MSILLSFTVKIKTEQLDVLVSTLSECPGFSGLQELGDAENGLLAPPEGFEVLEFGTAASQRFEDYVVAQGLGREALQVKIFFELPSKGIFDKVAAQVEAALVRGLSLHQALEWVEITPTDYLENYKNNVVPSEFGAFWVGPPWCTPKTQVPYVYFVEPGMAFGTGEHPTTQMCLERLNELRDFGFVCGRFLDLGTGSGLLALHAKRLYPEAFALASDLDPHCQEEFRKTLILNKESERGFVCVFGEGAELSALRSKYEPVDLLISNIYSEVLATLVADARKMLRPGGVWVVSGILEGAPETTLMDAAKGLFECRGRWTRKKADETETWVSLVLV